MVSEPMLQGRAWRDLSLTVLAPRPALEILEDLDSADAREAGLALGRQDPGCAVLVELLRRQQQGAHAFVAWSHRPAGGAAPFAVLGVDQVLAQGVGSAALLARPHARWSGPLRALAFALRRDLAPWAAVVGFHRLEARSWAGHPTAARLLLAIGFAHEARMPGFAAKGADFDLFSLSTRRRSGA